MTSNTTALTVTLLPGFGGSLAGNVSGNIHGGMYHAADFGPGAKDDGTITVQHTHRGVHTTLGYATTKAQVIKLIEEHSGAKVAIKGASNDRSERRAEARANRR